MLMRPLALIAGFLAATATDAWAKPAAGSLCSWTDGYYSAYSRMSAAPTGPAMDAWLAHFAPYAFFEDPTAGVSAIGHERIRRPYVEAFTGPLGPVKWTIQRCVSDSAWVAVDGVVDGAFQGKPVRARFTTWMKIDRERIVHQIDYVDYAALTGRDSTGYQPLRRPVTEKAPTLDPARAIVVTDEFYRRYDVLPAARDAAGVEHYLELLSADFVLEDPTARIALGSREAFGTALRNVLASGRYGGIHWQIDRRVTNGDWVAIEGSFRGTYDGRPFGTRFATWLQVRGDRVVQQIDYLDYATFRRQTAAAPIVR